MEEERKGGVRVQRAMGLQYQEKLVPKFLDTEEEEGEIPRGI